MSPKQLEQCVVFARFCRDHNVDSPGVLAEAIELFNSSWKKGVGFDTARNQRDAAAMKLRTIKFSDVNWWMTDTLSGISPVDGQRHDIPFAEKNR